MPRVDHWADIRDNSVRQLEPRKKLRSEAAPNRDLEPLLERIELLKIELEARDREIERLASELELQAVTSQPHRALSIAKSVAKKHGLSFGEMVSDRRQIHLVAARHEAMWMLYQHTELSLPRIAQLLNKSDHTTVLHGIRAHAKRNGLPITRQVNG